MTLQRSLINARLSLLNRLAVTQDKHAPEQGLTIMECLVAIMLIGLTVAMVTPPLLVATASRVQNRRAEQAAQVAQDEIDRINTMVQQGTHESRFLPKSIGPLVGGDFRTAVAAPTTQASLLASPRRRDISACPAASAPYGTYAAYTNQQLLVNQALPVDVDGDCTPDFFTQVFRTDGKTSTSELQKPLINQRPAKFEIGVRVYSALARNNFGTGNLKTDPAPILATGGQGKQATNPLITVYKSIAWGEKSDVLCASLKATDVQKIATCQ